MPPTRTEKGVVLPGLVRACAAANSTYCTKSECATVACADGCGYMHPITSPLSRDLVTTYFRGPDTLLPAAEMTAKRLARTDKAQAPPTRNQKTPHTMPHTPEPETNEDQTAKAVDPAAICSALPDASGLWWQWYQGMWRICLTRFCRVSHRWEFRWLNGDHWSRCHSGVFVRCEPPTWTPNDEMTSPQIKGENHG